MKQYWKTLSPILKIVNVIFIICIFSCDLSEESIRRRSKRKIPDEQIDSVKIVASKKDIIEWELDAVHIDRFYKTKEVLADTVFVKVFDPDGTIRSTLECDKAEMDETENLLICRGNVIVESRNGILKTPYLIWNRNSDELFAKEGVTLIRGENTIWGKEMKTDINLDKIKILEVSAEGIIREEEIDW